MEKIIRSKRSYFEEYSFKFNKSPATIISRFEGQRKQFVATVMNHCHTRKIWSTVDMPAILNSFDTDRQRIIAALEYFEEKGWIELQARQAVQVYDILTVAFDIDDMAEKMFALFKKKESLEIQRIHTMAGFFESDACLSRQLAAYFGEHLEQERCGHCSFCKGGKAILQHTTELKPLSRYNSSEVSKEFIRAVGERFSETNLVKFLCGIYSPVFSKLKIKNLPYFGIFEDYPFLEVNSWIQAEHPVLNVL
jgi:ATP-dependent DNA helicase RecQ